ncbi:HEXXH motif domain-containing protein [Hamadaea tsunoensis]|uniref:HEXXH motif domain-containing protein n=1 Tax=Hamadaea tsunoensis TaxID=53368 RepID=UPI000554A634|nr:HEXXH motif domain-containing protein [Hamadaea tsunoensis]
MSIYHELPSDVFDRLATGGGGADAIAYLRRAQLSRHRQLIGLLLSAWPGDPAQRDGLVDALDRAQRQDPAAFAEVFTAPLVGAWTGITVRAHRQGQATPADFAHLGGFTMVACAAAGVDAQTTIPVRDGEASLPGLGVALLPGADEALVTVEDSRLTVRGGGAVVEVPADPSRPAAGWLPVWILANAADAGIPARIELDDLDPYRHGHHAPPASRLAPAELDLWRENFADAWRMLDSRLPGRAAELAAGLRVLVPLAQTDARAARSATIRHAFGVFGLTRPPSVADFAVTLVHEFQHSKLSALLDLVPMSDPNDGRRFFAPWRLDPRPLAGLLQGVYAFVGVAETWCALRDVPGIGQFAEEQFAEARIQVDLGLTSVEESGALTPAGENLAAHLRRVTDGLLAVPIPAQTAQAAEASLAENRQRWLDRQLATA